MSREILGSQRFSALLGSPLTSHYGHLGTGDPPGLGSGET